MPDRIPHHGLPAQAPEGTRAALLVAAIRQFGRKGFAATSTRDIAGEAQTNVASIAYHFGSKDGLRRACAEEIARRITAQIGPLTAGPLPTEPAVARQILRTVVRTMVAYLAATRETEDMPNFVMREMADGGPEINVIYARLIAPIHERLTMIWSIAGGGDPASDDARLSVFAIIGQILYFRIGRPVVMRRMGWTAIGADEATRIADCLVRNLDHLLDGKAAT